MWVRFPPSPHTAGSANGRPTDFESVYLGPNPSPAARLDTIVKKVAKTHAQLINELKDQLSLLDDSIQKINSGDLKYSKALSGILRILVIETSTNRPLLKELFFASNTEKIRMTNEEFVKIASQQDGGSHVDPTIDFGYQFANEGILIEGLPPKVLKLIILANHVLKFGKELIAIIESKS